MESELLAASFTGNFGVAVGYNGTVVYTHGDQLWQETETGTSVALRGVVSGGGKTVMVGDHGAVLVFHEEPALAVSNRQGTARLEMLGQFGTQYVIESGETLGTTVPWKIHKQLPFTAPGEVWEDPNPIEPGTSRFYRVRKR